MVISKRPMPPIPDPLPPDFSMVKFWCDWHGLDHKKEQAKIKAGMEGRSTLGAIFSDNGHSCRAVQLEPPPKKRQSMLLKKQGLPIPCPFCASLTREQQIDSVMELLFDAIVEVARDVVKGGIE